MSNGNLRELARVGIAVDHYREFGRSAVNGEAAQRWPLLAMTDLLVAAERWNRESQGAQGELPRNVRTITTTRPTPAATPDWFTGGGAPTPAGNAGGQRGS